MLLDAKSQACTERNAVRSQGHEATRAMWILLPVLIIGF